jgi:hypothetical protein
MSCRKALVRLLLPLLALFVTAAAGAATIDPPLRYVLAASASNVSATVPFFDLASKTALPADARHGHHRPRCARKGAYRRDLRYHRDRGTRADNQAATKRQKVFLS